MTLVKVQLSLMHDLRPAEDEMSAGLTYEQSIKEGLYQPHIPDITAKRINLAVALL
jgi:hypothetical protein